MAKCSGFGFFIFRVDFFQNIRFRSLEFLLKGLSFDFVKRISFKRAVFPCLVLFFCLFPYVQLVPLSSYTQPYAFLFSCFLLVLRPNSFFEIPQLDRCMLLLLALLGVVMLLLEFPFGFTSREMSFILSYLTPMVTTVAAFWIIQRHPDLVRLFLIWAAVIWFCVGAAQILVSPSFLTFLVTQSDTLATDIRASGRGVLGLAPEPTHYAFHALLIAACLSLVGGPKWAVGLCVVAVVFFAQSSSAVLAVGLAVLVWAIRNPRWGIWLVLPVLVPGLVIGPLLLIVDEGSRLGSIVQRLSFYDLSFVLEDYSVNSRISGAVLPVYYAFKDFLFPVGFSMERWSNIRAEILLDQSWVMNLSDGGPATGIGLFLVQGGVFALPVVLYFVYRLVFNNQSGLSGFWPIIVFTIFLGQFYLSTPIFGLFFAALLIRIQARHSEAKASLGHGDDAVVPFQG